MKKEHTSIQHCGNLSTMKKFKVSIQPVVITLFFLLINNSQATNAYMQNNNNSNPTFNVIVIGGSSGMGKATAVSVVKRGGNVLIASRSEEKLKLASENILKQVRSELEVTDPSNNNQESISMIGNVETAVLDATNEESVQEFTEKYVSKDKWDGLVFSAAAKAPHGPIQTLPTSQTRDLFETKFWGAYLCAKYISPLLNKNGSIVFVSGVLNRRPGMNCSPLASTNGALEGLTRALALELGPSLRVNCLSPGFCNTERFDHMDEEKKEAMMSNTADSLPLQRVGTPTDMGESIYFLLTASFCTGVVLDCDGGHHIRQYANKSTDPFRKDNKN